MQVVIWNLSAHAFSFFFLGSDGAQRATQRNAQRVQQDETGPDDEKKNACSNSPTQQKDTLKYVSSVRAAKKRKNKVH